jgi:RimJ/RimL family protein N-acetyltransferase
VIRTDRLLLRRWTEADLAPFAAMNADPIVMEHMTGPLTREGSDAFVERIERHWDEHGWGLWAVEVPGVAAIVGYVGLWPADFLADGMVEVGWRLASAHWGRGYATEAARAALEFGFVEVGLAEIVSFTVPQNIRSRRVMERIGLVRDPAADFDNPRVDPVAYPHLVAHVMYRLDRATWQRRTG